MTWLDETLETFARCQRTGNTAALRTEGFESVGHADGLPLLALSHVRKAWSAEGSVVADLKRSQVLFDVLLALAEHGQLDAETLYGAAWGLPWSENRRNTVHVAVNRLRTKLGGGVLAVETLADRTYRMTPSISLWTRSPTKRAPNREPSPRQVPPPRGRPDISRELRSQVDRPGLITLVGPAGIGKSHLARWAVQELDGAVLVDLEGCQQVGDALVSVSDALGLQTSDHLSTSIGEAMGHVPVLVLDNVEHLLPELAVVVRSWSGTLLLTSRQPLALSTERVLRLGPLSEDHSTALLMERAPALDVHQARTIAASLGGLPLALELAAGRLQVLSPEELVARLDQLSHVLGGGRTDMPPSHRSMRAAIDRSWAPLEAWARRALIQLSPLAGGFTLALAEVTVDLSELEDAPWATDVIAALIQQSWLRRDSRTGRLHLFRVLADDLRRRGRDEPAAERAARWLLRSCPRTGRARLEWLSAERETLQCLFAELSGQADLRADILLHLAELPCQSGDDQMARFSAVASATFTDLDLASRFLSHHAGHLCLRGRPDEASAILDAAEVDSSPVQRARYNLARSQVHRFRREHEAVARCLTRAALLETEGDAQDRAQLHMSRSLEAGRTGDVEGAMAHMSRSAAVERSVGAGREAHTLGNLVAMLLSEGRGELAEPHVARGLELAQDPMSTEVPWMLSVAASWHAVYGASDRALALSRQALHRVRPTGNLVRIAHVLRRHVLIAVEAGAYQEAVDAATEVCAMLRDLGQSRRIAWVRLIQVWALMGLDRREEARVLLEEITMGWQLQAPAVRVTAQTLDGQPHEPLPGVDWSLELLRRWADAGTFAVEPAVATKCLDADG